MKRGLVVIAVLALPACMHAGERPLPPQPDPFEQPQAADPQKVQQISGELIHSLLDKGQYYAALAHIEEQKRIGDTAELTWLEAEARRHLGQKAQAEPLYRKLIGGPYEGQAYHGLGLLNAGTDLDATIRYLKLAVQRLPTDVEVRNDLGYALMESGRYTEAQPELATAAELAPTQLKSRNNLIILMLLVNNQAAVTHLAQAAGTTPETMKHLREQAQAIHSQQAARAARKPG